MSAKRAVDNKSIMKSKADEEIRQLLTNQKTEYDPKTVLHDLSILHGTYGKNDLESSNKEASLFINAMTLQEFENGLLMSLAIGKYYTTFGIEMLGQLQKEYNCVTFSEKATAELATISYVRTLEIQAKIKSALNKGTLTEFSIKFLAIMSKELDRATRHYLTAIQTLRSIKQPPMQVKISADTAVIGQNQVVQANHD